MRMLGSHPYSERTPIRPKMQRQHDTTRSANRSKQEVPHCPFLRLIKRGAQTGGQRKASFQRHRLFQVQM